MGPDRHEHHIAASIRAEPYRVPRKASLDALNDHVQTTDKENHPPQQQSPQDKRGNRGSKQSDRDLPADYLDIPLEEIDGEVPIYENCTSIRHKLNKLVSDKVQIPGSNKTFNKTNLSKELKRLAEMNSPIKTHNGVSNQGPSVPALDRFLKGKGSMGGGDSTSYYWGNMLLEKLRIWKGEPKTQTRKKAEEEFPKGRERLDPATAHFTVRKGEPITFDVYNLGRR